MSERLNRGVVEELSVSTDRDKANLALDLLAARAEIEDIKREWESCCERERARWEAEKELRAEIERLRMALRWLDQHPGGIGGPDYVQAAFDDARGK